MVDASFLVATIIVVVILLFYILYWNRLLAFVIGVVFRVVFWNRGDSSAWIRVGSFHISLLAGRILLKDFCYHSSNQTIKIVKVQLRWQYWIRSLTRSEDMQAHSGGEDPKSGYASRSSHCRFHATFEGFEWFIYNRTAAFNNIVSQMEAKTPVPERPAQSLSADGAAFQLRQFFSKSSPRGDNNVEINQARNPLTVPKFLRSFIHWLRGQLPGLDVKDLLPFSFEGINGGIVCGNMATSNILVAEFSRADGVFGTVPSKSPLDLHKQLLNIKFSDATISLRENDQYLAPMTNTGSHIHDQLHKTHSLSFHYFHHLTYSVFSKLYRSARLRDGLRAAASVLKKPTIAVSTKTFRSRSRRAKSVDIETPVGPDSAKREYAVERRLLETRVLELSYYVDVVGVVPAEQHPVNSEDVDIGNGDTSPEWGLHLVINGGFLRYGPWADRQRAELQHVFFPPTYQEADQTCRLRPNDNRVWTAMRVLLELRSGTTVHIPFREASKNWQWDGHVDVPRPRTREAASLSIKVGDDSTIRYLIPMVADSEGYHSHLNVHLSNAIVSSSLNDIRLLTTRSCEVSGEMPSPLKWDASRQWMFTVSLSQPIFCILRDHINMFTDLGKDWSSGPPSNYFTWVPIRYVVNLDLHDYEINTYVNDHNIIDKPLQEENALLTLRGPRLRNENVILSDKFRPAWTSFPFSIISPNVTLSLTLPKWSTHRLQTVEPITKLMTIGLFHLEGSYLYHSDVREGHVDQLTLKFMINDAVFKCLAWSIRHFMIFQQNYFGNFTHFSTLREYLQKRSQGQIGDPIDLKYRPGMSNQMQVELQMSVNHSLIVLPVGLPGYEMYCPLPGQSPEDVQLGECIVLSVPETGVQLRTHNLGLELNLNIGTIYGDVESNYTERSVFTRSHWVPSSEFFLIEGIDILADRLFGPQPLAAAYVCFWEISLGSVKGVLSASLAQTLQSALDAFAMNYKDPMNSPAAEFALPLTPDVTFFKVGLASVDLTWSAAPVSVHCFLPEGFHMASNDLAGNHYRKVTSLTASKVVVRFLRSLGKRNDWIEAGEVVFDVSLDNYSSPLGWEEGALSQAKFLAEQDEPTGRLRKLNIGLGKRGRWMPSRSLYAAVLRLPRPHHVPPSTATQHAPLVEDALQGAEVTKPVPFFQRHVYSDSDEEGSYTAMDRDARLANSRPPSTLPPTQVDNESMSDGDESDNMDLTDLSSYESDVSEGNEDASATFEDSLTYRYSKVSKHYSLSIGKPSSWIGTPVVILRDRRPFTAPAASPDVTSIENDYCSYKLWKADITEDSSSVSTIRISSRSIEIWVTPLLPSVILRLLEDNARAEMSLEQRLDSLVTSHIRDLLKEQSPANDSVFDVQISSIRAQVVQLVHEPQSQHDGFLHAPSATHDQLEGKVAVLDFQVFNLGLKGQKHQEEKHPRQSFAISIDHTALLLDLHDVHGPANRSEVYTAVRASLSEVVSALAHKRADFVWRALSVVLEMDAAYYISEIVPSLTDPIIQAVNSYRRLRSRLLSEARARIYQALQWSKKLPMIDPLSTTQPSFLIQTGRPHEIRVHAASKILLSIRGCLRFLTPEEREAICHPTGVEDTLVTREEVITLLELQLAGLAVDADAASFANLNLMTRMFRTPVLSKTPRRGEQAIQAAMIKLRTTKVAVLHPKHGAPSEVSLDMVDITVAIKESELLVGSSKSPKDPSSTEGRYRPVIQHVAASVALDSLEVLMLPHILIFAQSLVRLRKKSRDTAPNSTLIPPSDIPRDRWKTTLLLDATLSLQSLRLRVAAEKLIVAYIVSRLGFVSSVYTRPHVSSPGRPDLSANLSLFFDSVALQAHSSTDNGSSIPQDMLAEISLTETGLNCALRQEVTLDPTIRVALAVGSLQFSVPRSAIRLSRFIEEWKADYLPSFEQTIRALVSELRQEPVVSSTPTGVKHLVPTMQLQFSIGSCGAFFHVLPGTWLSWELVDTVAYLKLGVGVATSRQSSAPFGLRFSSQRIIIASPSKGQRLGHTPEKGGLKVDLPSMTVTGTYESNGVHVLISAGFFSISVKPSYWDTLLSVQQKFGNDINDLLHVLADARARRSLSQGPAKSQTFSSQLLLHSGAFKAKGFRIGLEGHSSMLLFECQDVSGGLTDGEIKGRGKLWQLNVIGLALSLAPRSFAAMKSESGGFDGSRRSAFVKIDSKIEVDHRSAKKFLRIKVSKIHAIMQPSSIGEIGDFIDHLQAEVLNRKDERVRELAVFKEKTQSIFKAFEVKDRESTPRDATAWFKDYAIVLSVGNVGVAFPLALDSSIELPLGKPHQHLTVSAFLFSVKTVEFEDKSMGDSHFVMKEFSFQFVDRFRQSVPGDFAGNAHKTRNRLIYPDMIAQVRTERSAKSIQIRMGANISGFIFDLEPSIADRVASLVDVYRRGKERVDRITVNVPRNDAVQDLRPRAVSESNETVQMTSSVLLSMVFLSGQVRMHGSSLRTSTLYDTDGRTLPPSVIECFNLPMLSVWGEYRATPTSRRLTMDDGDDHSSLVLKSTIHSSENTLRPTLLPFITDLVNHIERRMRKSSPSSSSFVNRGPAPTAPLELNAPTSSASASSMHITFALRIDQSKLQLTCQPDVNVIAGVYWDSGGFLLNVSRSGRRISFIGNVGGLTIGLKHGFLSEDCVRLDARNLAFSTTFTGADKSSGIDVSSMSVVVDTEVSGGLRFSRFQDVLCFKAVWLDRIPVLSATPGNELAENPVKAKALPTPGATSTVKGAFTTAVLVRFRRIGLNVDLGQSISSVRMDMLNVTLQSKIEEMCAELSVSIGDLTMSATGNISGNARIPDFSFNTMRRKSLVFDSPDLLGEPRMLDMSMKSGNLEITLESDYQKILHLWSGPLSITVWDDWTQMSPQVAVLDRSLRLSFAVSGAELIAVGSIGTIPKLFSYGSRFQANLQAQREGAARESKAFRITQSPKPDNPLSAFANAMLQTARTRLREKEDSLSYVVQQRMQFSLRSLKLVVFPRTMEDHEMASFSASELRADLDLIVESNDLPAKRKLLLAFAGMSASRVGPLNHGMVSDDVRTDVRKWLDALQKAMAISTIFELPAMDMEMESEEIGGILEYNFESKFAQGGKPTARREDIFITLNVALYSWLTLLRKNLAREMSQAQRSFDRRQVTVPGTATPSGVSTPARRRTITDSSALDTTSSMAISQTDRHLSPQPRAFTRSDAAIERQHRTTFSMSAMPNRSDTLGPPIELAMASRGSTTPLLDIPVAPSSPMNIQPPPSPIAPATSSGPPSLMYQPRRRHIERLQMRQLGEATPDVMHPFFTKKAGFNLEDALPQYVHEYGTMPIEEITRALLKLYSRQLSHSAPQ